MFLVFLILAMVAAAVIGTLGGRNLERAATGSDLARVASRKHVRVAHYAAGFSIVYYGDDGRKVTARHGLSCSDAIRLRKAAAGRGYASISF